MLEYWYNHTMIAEVSVYSREQLSSSVAIVVVVVFVARRRHRDGCRRRSYNMIGVFKITHNRPIYDPDMSLKLEHNTGYSTRGNKYKLLNHKFHCGLRKYYFCARIVHINFGVAYQT